MRIKNLKPALYIIAALLPLAFGMAGISGILLPVVLSYLYAREGMGAWLTACAAAFIFTLLTYSLDVTSTAIFISPAYAVSLFIGGGIRKKRTFSMTLITACTAHICVTAGILMYYSEIMAKSAFDLLFAETFTAINTIFANGTGNEEIIAVLELLRGQMEILLPSMLILSTCFSVYLTFAIVRAWLSRRSFAIDNMPYFYELRLGSGFTTVFLIILMASLFTGISVMSMNVLTVVTALFAVCGLSVCDYHLKRRGVSIFFRSLIYIAVFAVSVATGYFSALILLTLLGAGIIDSYKSLRSQKDML